MVSLGSIGFLSREEGVGNVMWDGGGDGDGGGGGIDGIGRCWWALTWWWVFTLPPHWHTDHTLGWHQHQDIYYRMVWSVFFILPLILDLTRMFGVLRRGSEKRSWERKKAEHGLVWGGWALGRKTIIYSHFVFLLFCLPLMRISLANNRFILCNNSSACQWQWVSLGIFANGEIEETNIRMISPPSFPDFTSPWL